MILANGKDVLDKFKPFPRFWIIGININKILQFTKDISKFTVRREHQLAWCGFNLDAEYVMKLQLAGLVIEII